MTPQVRADEGIDYEATVRYVQNVIHDAALALDAEGYAIECARLKLADDKLVALLSERSALRAALAAYRSAMRCGERETEQLRKHGDAALALPATEPAQPEHDPEQDRELDHLRETNSGR